MSTHPDTPDTSIITAYIAIGAHQSLSTWRESHVDEDIPGNLGECEFFERIIQHADHLADLTEQANKMDDFFLYVIAEPFGIALADSMLHLDNKSAGDIAVRIIKEHAA